MNLELLKIDECDLQQYKTDLQEAFQLGYEGQFGHTSETILPEKDIDKSPNSVGAIAYKAVENGKIVGGAIIVIDEKTQHNHLDFLYVKRGVQGKGVGKAIWFAIEKKHQLTKVWETCTPYFEKRNMHFYVNVCGFHIVEFFNEKHPMLIRQKTLLAMEMKECLDFKRLCKVDNRLFLAYCVLQGSPSSAPVVVNVSYNDVCVIYHPFVAFGHSKFYRNFLYFRIDKVVINVEFSYVG